MLSKLDGMDVSLDEALAVALQAADAARAAIMARYRSGFTVSWKADRSEVTEADREAEQAIREVIRASFPDHGISGEELGSDGAGRELTWLVDPIDGTSSFVHRIPLFSTLIALCRGGQPIAAVVDFPALDRRFHATLGGGAWEGSARLQLAEGFDPRTDLVCSGDYSQFEDTGRIELHSRLQREARLFRTYTDAHGHCLVASGSAALMVDPDLKPWDLAAPSLIVREAGGQMLQRAETNGHVLVVSGTKSAVAWLASRLD